MEKLHGAREVSLLFGAVDYDDQTAPTSCVGKICSGICATSDRHDKSIADPRRLSSAFPTFFQKLLDFNNLYANNATKMLPI